MAHVLSVVQDHQSPAALTRGECLDLLAQQHLGRVAASISALPVILPVYYAVFEESVLLRTVRGTKLHMATRGSIVAFEADAYRADGTDGWSVLVVGKANEVTAPADLERVRAVPMHVWGADRQADQYLRIEANEVSGRRFGGLGGVGASPRG